MLLSNRIQEKSGELTINENLIKIYNYKTKEYQIIEWDSVIEQELKFGSDNLNLFSLNWGVPGKFCFYQSGKKKEIFIALKSKSFINAIKSFIYFRNNYKRNTLITFNNPFKK